MNGNEVLQQPRRFIKKSFKIDLTVDLAIQRTNESEQAPSLLLALHGFGQSCEKFIRVFQPMTGRNIVVAAPQAPHQFYVKTAPKIVGFTWLTKYERDRSVEDFVNYMTKTISAVENECGASFENIFLLGFSQGVSMAYRLAVSGKITPKGLIACGADLPPDVRPKLRTVKKFPVLLTHGLEDALVPLHKAEEAEDILKENGFFVEKHLFPGGHEIPRSVVNKVGDWMGEQHANV